MQSRAWKALNGPVGTQPLSFPAGGCPQGVGLAQRREEWGVLLGKG